LRMPISRESLKEIEMNPMRTSRWSCTGRTIQAARIEPSREIETLTADKQKGNGCPEGFGLTEVGDKWTVNFKLM
jgi:hypothetical protein